MSIARAYPYALDSMPTGYSDYEHAELEWQYVLCFVFSYSSDPSRYQIIKKVGKGKYSEVFKGIDIQTGEFVSIKYLKPVVFKKIKRYVYNSQLLDVEKYVLCSSCQEALPFCQYAYSFINNLF